MLLLGVRAIPRAFGFLRAHRELWAVCVLPLLTNVVVLALATLLFWSQLDVLVSFVEGALATGEVEAWYQWLWVGPLRAVSWLAKFLLVLLFAALLWIAALLLGSVIASPFLDLLAQRVEGIASGTVRESPATTARVVFEESKRVGFLFAVSAGWLVVGLVPGLQPVALIGVFATTALLLPLEYTGYLLDRRGFRFRTRFRWLRSHGTALFPFGVTALASFAVPGLNFLCLPLLVTAGTLLGLELEGDGEFSPDRESGSPSLRATHHRGSE